MVPFKASIFTSASWFTPAILPSISTRTWSILLALAASLVAIACFRVVADALTSDLISPFSSALTWSILVELACSLVAIRLFKVLAEAWTVCPVSVVICLCIASILASALAPAWAIASAIVSSKRSCKPIRSSSASLSWSSQLMVDFICMKYGSDQTASSIPKIS